MVTWDEVEADHIGRPERGSCRQRKQWSMIGYHSGRPDQCDTFRR